MNGKLIVFEGISGTGKETQAKLLQEYLANQGIKSHIVYHPSRELKEILAQWRKKRNIDHVSEAYFLLADRYNRVEEVITPALKRGEWVISLRNFLSALVYQGKTQKERAWIAKEFARFEPKADVLFHFDIDEQTAFSRIMKRHQETGEPVGSYETKEILREKAHAYRSVLKRIPHVTIDASRSVEKIHQDIILRLSTKFHR